LMLKPAQRNMPKRTSRLLKNWVEEPSCRAE
jgi:hypothetical protein